MMKDSIDHIILPDMVIAALYRQTLVVHDATPGNVPAITSSQAPIKETDGGDVPAITSSRARIEEADAAPGNVPAITSSQARLEEADAAPGNVPAITSSQARIEETDGGNVPTITSSRARIEETDVAPGDVPVADTWLPTATPTPEAEKETARGLEARKAPNMIFPKEVKATPEAGAGEAGAAPVITGAASATQPYRVLGNNSKKVAVIVHFPGDAFLPEQHLQFLGKILGACKMNLGDIAIVNHAAQPVIIGQLKQQLQPTHVLLFGPAPTDIQLPLNFTPFKQQQYDGCQYLYAPSLNELNQEGERARQLKGQLWTCLKKMFDI